MYCEFVTVKKCLLYQTNVYFILFNCIPSIIIQGFDEVLWDGYLWGPMEDRPLDQWPYIS